MANYLANMALKTKKDDTLENLKLDFWFIGCQPPCNKWMGFEYSQDWAEFVEENSQRDMRRQLENKGIVLPVRSA